MDKKSLDLLEFPKVRELIAGYTSFEVSHELATAIEPLADAARVDLLLKQSGEARRLLEADTSFVIGAVRDIREVVKMAALGKVIDPLSLLDVQQMLSAMRLLRRSLSKHSTGFPTLWSIVSGIRELPDVERSIEKCISPSGDVLDSASSELSDIRRKLRKTRENLVNRLEATLKSARGQRIIQEPIITEREGRYVIPVKAEHRKDIRGIVHDVSNTGATLFIEPWATLDLGNDVRELISQEKYEIERILGDLSSKLAVHAHDISKGIELTAEFDLVLAKAKYASTAHAVEPHLAVSGRNPVLRLRQARHPLLGDKAVPLSVDVGDDFSILVITGPNMGGKTVALKTVGLLSAMALSGLPIPAGDESTVPLFDGIYADIGDEQSIEHTVSTFSWHVGNIVRIIQDSTSGSLVLLDELGAATDPAEGSALAHAILVFFLSRKTLAVTTSHYDDLKAFAHSTKGLKNASLDLDAVTRMPTYHLTVGVPGGSNALAVALHLGLPEPIIQDARQMLGKGTQELDSLLSDLGKERGVISKLRTELDEERRAMKVKENELEQRAQQVRADERRAIERTRDVVVREAADLQRDIRAALSDLRKTRTKETVEHARQALASVQQTLRSDTWSPPPAEEAQNDLTIKPGDTVLVRDSNVKATVLSVLAGAGQAEIQAGRARMTIGLSGLDKVMTDPKVGALKVFPITKQVSTEPLSLQLDLRGKRDEVEIALDNYLNAASLSGLSEVRIIHGMATGTVRKIVREFLSTHPLVRSYRAGDRAEGGDGATVAKL